MCADSGYSGDDDEDDDKELLTIEDAACFQLSISFHPFFPTYSYGSKQSKYVGNYESSQSGCTYICSTSGTNRALRAPRQYYATLSGDHIRGNRVRKFSSGCQECAVFEVTKPCHVFVLASLPY